MTVVTFFTLYSQADISDLDTIFIWGNVLVLRFFLKPIWNGLFYSLFSKETFISAALNVFFVNIYPPLLKVKKVWFYNGPEAKPGKN